MDPQRLQQLKRQKALLLEHLEWIDQEIDRESVALPTRPARAESAVANRFVQALPDERPVARSLEPESSSADEIASDLYSELGPDTRSAVADTKRGCLLFGLLAFAALAGLAVYVAFYY